MIIGAGLKMYLGHWETLDWLREVARLASSHQGLRSGAVELFVLPSFTALPQAVQSLSRWNVGVGAQDLFWADRGPFTGEVSGAALAELGCRYAEVGHVERREHLGETDEIVSRKTAAAFRNRLVPVICVGEASPGDPAAAAEHCARQLHTYLEDSTRGSTMGPAVVAYEPHWAIGTASSAEPGHIRTVCTRLRDEIAGVPGLRGTRVVYGGSAGAGLLGLLDGAVDGLFLGRASHDPAGLAAVLDEAASVAALRSAG